MTRPHPYRRARQLLGLTQIECAMRTGMSQSKLSLIERGYLLPSEAEAHRLSEVVGGHQDELFPETRRTTDRRLQGSER